MAWAFVRFPAGLEEEEGGGAGSLGEGTLAMLSLPPSVRIFLAGGPKDPRKSFDPLAPSVFEVMDKDPQSGHRFVFFRRRRDRGSVLWRDRTYLAAWRSTETARPSIGRRESTSQCFSRARALSPLRHRDVQGTPSPPPRALPPGRARDDRHDPRLTGRPPDPPGLGRGPRRTRSWANRPESPETTPGNGRFSTADDRTRTLGFVGRYEPAPRRRGGAHDPACGHSAAPSGPCAGNAGDGKTELRWGRPVRRPTHSWSRFPLRGRRLLDDGKGSPERIYRRDGRAPCGYPLEKPPCRSARRTSR